MSTYFDAVVVAARQADLIGWLKAPPVPGPLVPLNLDLHRFGRGRFVVFAWRAGAARPDAWAEVQALAYDLSFEFGTAVAVHYDDQVSVRLAAVARDGEPLRQFGVADEVWVPFTADGELVTTGPRYAGNALPDGIECDCIRNGIDAAFEAAGFPARVTAATLVAVVYRNQPVWQRPGVARPAAPAAPDSST